MMKTFLALLACLLLLGGCQASCDISTAGIEQVATARSVDPESKAPVLASKDFKPSDQTIYAAALVKNAPAGTKVAAHFFFLEGKEQQIASDEIAMEGSRWVSFSLSPPVSGWPTGKYEVRFLLNGKVQKKESFQVLAAGAAQAAQPAPPQGQAAGPSAKPPASAGAQPSAGAYKRLEEPTYGFALEIPAEWSWQLLKDGGGYFITGPAGSPSNEIALILQIVNKVKGGTTLQAQMEHLLDQYAKLPGGKILKKDAAPVAGQQAPFFLASYSAKDNAGRDVEFGHAQLGLDHGAYVLLVSFAAPTEIYKSHLATFQRSMDSFKLQ